jgi:ATP-dependent DNA helicase RecG
VFPASASRSCYHFVRMLEPSTPVQYVKGIGPRLAEVLSGKGIHTVEDLLHYLPFRYEDRLNPRGIAELRVGEIATVIAEVRNSGLFRTKRMPIFQMTAGQGRSRLKCLWFNGAYLQGRFQPGQLVALYGKVEEDRGELQIVQPQFEILGDSSGEPSSDDSERKLASSLEVGRIVPIYESAGQGRVTARWFRRIIHTALKNLTPDLPDDIPASVRSRMALIPPREALWKVHWPDAGESLALLQAARSPAHIRLIFEELFFLELGLEFKRRQMKPRPASHFVWMTGLARRSSASCRFIPPAPRKKSCGRLRLTWKSPIPCAVCCRATWDQARPSWRLKPR